MNKPIANKLLDEINNEIDNHIENNLRGCDDDDIDCQEDFERMCKISNIVKQLENEVIKELYLDNKWLIKIIKQSQKDNKVIDFMTTNDNVFYRNFYQPPTPNDKCNCECHNADTLSTCMGICCYKRKENKDE